MAYHFIDNVYTKSFTPKEYQVELLDAAKNRNIIVCVGNGPNKTFIALKLIQELSNSLRKSVRKYGQRMVYLTATDTVVSQMGVVFRNLTDLNVGEYISSEKDLDLDQNQVLVMTSEACWDFIQTGQLNFKIVNLLIVDECHHSIRDHPMKKVMEACWHVLGNPEMRVVGLTSPLMPGPGGGEPGRLEAEVKRLEHALHCKAETASDIVSVLRYCSKPKETVIECDNYELTELCAELEGHVALTYTFLQDHRYDPFEIYDEDFAEDLKDIPDPKTDPFNILNDFREVLVSMGPFCADKAALLLLMQIEKLKVKTPYERHYLLLCLVSSVMLKIRAIIDSAFEAFDEKERIYKFSSPKILKLIEVLRQFKPKKSAQSNAVDEKSKEDSAVEEKTLNVGEESSCRIEKLETVVEEENREELNNSSGIDGVLNSSNTSVEEVNFKRVQSESDGVSKNSNTVVKSYNNVSLYEIQSVIDGVSNNINTGDDSFKNELLKPDGLNSEQLSNDTHKNSEQESPSHSFKNNLKNLSETDKQTEEINICNGVIGCDVVISKQNESIHNGMVNEVSNLIGNKSLSNGCDDDDVVLSKENENCLTENSGDSVGCKNVVDTINLSVGDSLVVNDRSDVDCRAEGSAVDSGVASCSQSEGAMSNDERSIVEETSTPWEFQGRGGRWRGRGRGWRYRGRNQQHPHVPRVNRFILPEDADNLCALVLVENRFTAKILSHFLNDLKRNDPDLNHVCAQFTVSKIADPVKEPREAEIEHRKQEEVLKRFRMRECNVLVGTSLLEDGIDLPKCNLVVRYNVPTNYRSYAQSKGRARAPDSHYVHLIERENCDAFITDLAQFMEIEKMLLRRCSNQEPSEDEEREADLYNDCVTPYKPKQDSESSVTMANSVASVNRYCAKLPSDTFTRLTPQATLRRIFFNEQDMYVCTIRLPINSPVKQDIVGHPMPTRVLARRIAAMEACRTLYEARELDDNLQPIGKERFQMLDSANAVEVAADPDEPPPQLWDIEPRPGTTKRRQYYYKRIADALNDCRPREGIAAMLYHLDMTLTCPLPEEQNTRGRKLHPPEDSPQGFGILTLKTIPKICPFPIFTRSGEVRVSLNLCDTNVSLDEIQMKKILTFLNFTFTSVLRLQKYLMLFDENAKENSYLIVPTRKNEQGVIEVDWDFLDVIFVRRTEVPHDIPDEQRKDFAFDPAKYLDAVVMPWYRNQDQPQYFYVAEICNHLNPKSSFPGYDYKTFEEYYYKKYGYLIQNWSQPLLDVDHTSARLNFLTPRYVNRKGVALPTSSEETKRAKRENLEQKQILVPELCMVHPFPASLWRKAVCLPCILYRINALLLADEIRTTVSREIGLGIIQLDPNFDWKPLDFGWSLADVLKKSKEDNERLAQAKMKNLAKITDGSEAKADEEAKQEDEEEMNETNEGEKAEKTNESKDEKKEEDENEKSKDGDEDEEDGEEKEEEKDAAWMEIGTWSNEMAIGGAFMLDDATIDQFSSIRYGSPSWEMEAGMDYYDSEESADSDDYSADEEHSEAGAGGVGGGRPGGLRIMFKSDFLAEAIDDDDDDDDDTHSDDGSLAADWQWHDEEVIGDLEAEIELESKKYGEAVVRNEEYIRRSNTFLKHDECFVIARNEASKPQDNDAAATERKDLGFAINGYSMPEKMMDCGTSDSGVSLDRSIDGSSSSLGSSSMSDDLDVPADELTSGFSFDSQPALESHPGPSPSVLLQALTMSNANDGINLERLETIGDSFLKFAITTYLYCVYESVHEGKLSHLRSKQVSNLNLYRLGKHKIFGESMIATKFEPHDNWLPPCYFVPKELERALIEAGVPAFQWNQAELPSLRDMSTEEINAIVKERGEQLQGTMTDSPLSVENLPCFVPYNLITQHSIPDKSIADCVEALIGAYLIECGPRGALIFMSWLGIKVLPCEEVKVTDDTALERPVGSHLPDQNNMQIRYGFVKPPRSPLLRHVSNPECELERLLAGFDVLERSLRYRFNDRSYLLQAMTHASYHTNRLTDCYQRLEFLGDAVLDYLITRHLYEDKRQHCPGDLTDLRSALVNNTIFASLAVRHGFHKYFCHLSPGLSEVIERFVRIQEENGHAISEECYLIGEEECEEAEDVEVPKALGDVFESVAGAIFLDSGMSLDAVWMVYYHMMKNEIDQFSTNVPKSPIRELLELEPETAKFGKPEKLADGRRVRVNVEVFGKGTYKGIGRNYRIAKCTAAKCALKQLKKQGLLAKRFSSRW
ncbi:LOW QUALITY PROTEIN: endoribonuclease Dcr-1 [Nilaparvata lugens]|uniref:LOW QUALITY PROTEIN: endoribonuclease Dcr-1 n=1 Tax=Nilaparvata lugens TaxID=108931 RepID=UPI00193E23F9|nr:LOW QUALITY PROTEIN: endoribonuclease Dcr-1 [Nilaparvata lugens]